MLQPNDFEKIEMFAKEVDNHLRKIYEFIPKLHEVNHTLKTIISAKDNEYLHEIKLLKEQMFLIQNQLELMGMPKINIYEHQFSILKSLLLDDKWPEAVNIKNQPKSEQDFILRANNIIDLIIVDWLEGQKFLDFGCGDGWIAHQTVTRKTTLSVGYDIQQSFTAPQIPGLLLTQNFQEVEAKGPYDIVLIHDVLDHMVNMDQINILHRIKNILSPKGRIYVRTHPWCSKHGGHYFNTLNKSYAHLIFDEIELTRIGGYASDQPAIHVIHPLNTYRNWFKDCGFEIVEEHIIQKEIPSFFTKNENPLIYEKLKKHWNEENPFPHMGIEFVNYKLVPKEPSNKQMI